LKHDARDKGECVREIILAFISAFIRAFIAEYRNTIIALALLCILSAYAVQTQRLFEFLVFVVMMLQLELAYIQRWLKAGKRDAKLEAHSVHVNRNMNTLVLDIVNTGGDVAYHVNIPYLIIPLSTYVKLLELFPLRPALFKHFPRLLTLCAKCRGGIDYRFASLQPKARRDFTADLSDCLKDYSPNDRDNFVVFAGICRGTSPELFSRCDTYVAVTLKKPAMVWRQPLEREPPGVLTRIPNMIDDLMLVLQVLRQSINSYEAVRQDCVYSIS
jgi:hypothetical protein